MTYYWLLFLHGAIRWVVLTVGVLAILRAWRGSGRGEWTDLDEKLGMTFISLLDIQLLFGMILYVISPLRVAAYAAPRSSLGNETGFFAILHPALMIAAIVVAHVGKALSKRAEAPILKQSRVLAYSLATIILIAVAIPWWRPILRPLS